MTRRRDSHFLSHILLAVLPLPIVLFGIGHFSTITGSPQNFWRLFRYSYLGCEFCLPSFYSSALFFAAAALQVLLGLKMKVHRWNWFLSAALFLYLAFDDWFRLHEQIGSILPEAVRIDRGNALSGWLVFGLLLAMIGARLVYPLLQAISLKERAIMTVSAALFLSGALGCELIGWLHPAVENTREFAYGFLVGIEEMLELSGLSLFLWSLSRSLKSPHVESSEGLEILLLLRIFSSVCAFVLCAALLALEWIS